MTVFVLWEDKANGPIDRFGPHQFLVACVAARLVAIDRYELMRSQIISGKPCGGNGNVLRELGHGPLGNSVRHVIAVLDTDKLHHRVPGISARSAVADTEYNAWSDAAGIEIRKHASATVQDKLAICLLDRNLETLLSLVGHGTSALPAALKKELLERDKVLHRAAADQTLVHRSCAEMPSWGYLVSTVTRMVQLDTPSLVTG